jgi:hypothetical protein
MRFRLLVAIAAVSLSFPAAAEGPIPTDWRKVATDADRSRLRRWRDAWMEALPRARAAQPDAVARLGALLDPDRALDHAVPAGGDYQCRVFKLGGRGARTGGFVAYPAFTCRVDDEGAIAAFYKADGSQRPVGLIFRESDGRGVFLGTLVLGDETMPIDYGRDRMRDMAGIVERVEPQRWRISFPWPHFESTLDVIELVPAPPRR